MSTVTSDEQHALKKILSLDLEPMKGKLMDAERGLGWSDQQAEEAEKWYKRFLFLHFKYPGKCLVPTSLIDELWHCHILDTQKYAADCDSIFGEFLHHVPTYGSNTADDEEAMKSTFEETKKLFDREFGTGYLIS